MVKSIGKSPRQSLHEKCLELETQNRLLIHTVESYARPQLLGFLEEKGALIPPGPSDWTNFRMWLIATGQHKGRGVVSAKEAKRLKQLTEDSRGWWTDSKTFIHLDKWRVTTGELLQQYRQGK